MRAPIGSDANGDDFCQSEHLLIVLSHQILAKSQTGGACALDPKANIQLVKQASGLKIVHGSSAHDEGQPGLTQGIKAEFFEGHPARVLEVLQVNGVVDVVEGVELVAAHGDFDLKR